MIDHLIVFKRHRRQTGLMPYVFPAGTDRDPAADLPLLGRIELPRLVRASAKLI